MCNKSIFQEKFISKMLRFTALYYLLLDYVYLMTCSKQLPSHHNIEEITGLNDATKIGGVNGYSTPSGIFSYNQY